MKKFLFETIILKRAAAVPCAVLILAVSALAAFAAPPANDNFASAQTLAAASGTVNATNAEATKEPAEPAHALNRGGRSVWYKYVAQGNGVLRLNLSGSNFNTLLAVYTGSNLSDLELVGANDDFAENGAQAVWSTVRIGAKTGDVFYIAVDGFWNGASSSTGNLALNYFFEGAVSNDNFANATTLGSAEGKLNVTTNVGASKESGEPNHAGNAGGKSVWFKWTAPADIPRTYSLTVRARDLNSSTAISVLTAVYTGSSLASLTPVASRSHGQFGKLVFTTVPGTTYHFAVDGRNQGSGADMGNFTIRYGVNKSDKVADLDGDGKADLSVFRPATGTWFMLESVTDTFTARQYGSLSDRPLWADMTVDGVQDMNVFRPSLGRWFTQRSDGLGTIVQNWGTAGDIPMISREFKVGNRADRTVFRPSNGTWYFLADSTPQTVQWGTTGDIPVLADFNGDGNDDLTVFRPSTGTWYIRTEKFVPVYETVTFGLSEDKPVVADYDGDGRADVALFRPSTGSWFVLRSSDGALQTIGFGLAGDTPQPADYDGDSKADYAVYRSGVWWILQSSNGALRTTQFGLSTDLPSTSPSN